MVMETKLNELKKVATEKEILEAALEILRRKGIPQSITLDHLEWLISVGEVR